VTDLATLAASLEQCYDVLEAPCARLSSDQWQAQSLCPDWDTRGVVTHLGSRPVPKKLRRWTGSRHIPRSSPRWTTRPLRPDR